MTLVDSTALSMSPYSGLDDLYANLTAAEWTQVDAVFYAPVAMSALSLLISALLLLAQVVALCETWLPAWTARNVSGYTRKLDPYRNSVSLAPAPDNALRRRARRFDDSSQFNALLLSMTVSNIVFQSLQLASDLASPRSSDEYCTITYVDSMAVYGICYMFIYAFLVKKALVVRSALIGSGAEQGNRRRVAWVVAIAAFVSTMPVFVALTLAGSAGFASRTGCYGTFGHPVSSAACALAGTLLLNGALLYLFVGPLYHQAHRARDMAGSGPTTTHLLQRVATKNVVLVTVSVSVQCVFLLVTLVYEALVASFVTTLFSPEWALLWALEFLIALDPTVSMACCFAMTSVWQPSVLREQSAARCAAQCAGRRAAAQSHAYMSEGGGVGVVVADVAHKSVIASQSTASSPSPTAPSPRPLHSPKVRG